nr:tRNA lysidine(34) synthetase TilS [Gemmobacter aestuarii]
MLSASHPFPPDARRIGVAVSGGGDSMALLHLLHRAAPHRGFSLSAVTVDHRLRPEAAAEAHAVARFCAGLGVPHETLVWDHGAIQGNVMDEARRARISLISAWARAKGIGHVALGHTADDRAEGFLMGLGRASGLDGLTGLRPFWREAGVWWGRPLLLHGRQELRAYLTRHGIGWIDDPTNEDDRFARIRARRALAALAPLGITIDRLATTIDALTEARRALEAATKAAAARMDCAAGALRIGQQDLADLPREIRRRLLTAAIRWMGGADYPPREAKVAHLLEALDEGRDATLGGVRFRSRKGGVSITREPRAACGPVAIGQVWDHRWQVEGPDLPGAHVAALGAEGLRQVADWRQSGLARDVLAVTPAIWQGKRLIAAPSCEKTGQWRATCCPSFVTFILSD